MTHTGEKRWVRPTGQSIMSLWSRDRALCVLSTGGRYFHEVEEGRFIGNAEERHPLWFQLSLENRLLSQTRTLPPFAHTIYYLFFLHCDLFFFSFFFPRRSSIFLNLILSRTPPGENAGGYHPFQLLFMYVCIYIFIFWTISMRFFLFFYAFPDAGDLSYWPQLQAHHIRQRLRAVGGWILKAAERG